MPRSGLLSPTYRRGRLAAAVSAIVLGCIAPVSGAAPDLATVLAKMDAAASGWKGMRASLEWVRYMALVDDRSVEQGKIVVRRTADGSASMLISFEEPNVYFLSVKGARVEIYKPKIKTVEEYDVSDSKAKVENALLLGFGTTGSYLGQHYDIKLLGPATVKGQSAVHLDLQPKDPQAELNSQRIEMWVSTDIWQPVQQKIYDRSPGDYRLYSYSEVVLNPSLTAEDFKLRLARGTKRVHPQR
ncbi:MAG: outer membrane lipoprotein carrier protein LolA [Bryobacterales bacterium]|nr:outer membrane lipoprotein carrier protein LolA [Bryobacterales bacterium]MDE0624248.1 outer membrane lipoprotein carrier protein LolA [Bryobacterales bacterium]